MFQKLRNSWTVFKASASVLAADKELIIFPVVSGIAALLVMASFVLPMTFLGGWDYVGQEGGWNPLAIAVAFLFYFCLNTVVFYFNAALVGAALIRLDGGDPTVGDGLRIANSRLGPILGYAAISATVGLLLKWGRGRSGKLGRFVISLVGIAWTLATYLVVPVLVVQKVGPIDGIKESAALFRRTWGEQVVGTGGIGLISSLATFALILFGVLLMIPALAIGNPAVVIALGVLLALAFVGMIALTSALKGIYTAALYHFAAKGNVSQFYDSDRIRGAFVQK